MRLSTRLAVVTVALVTLTTGAFAILSDRAATRIYKPAALHSLQRHAGLLTTFVEQRVAMARARIVGVRESPFVSDLVAAQRGEGSLETARQRLASALAGDMRLEPATFQLRYLDAHDGKELVRVERPSPDAAPAIADRAQLQDKSHRGYFKRAVELPPGGVYVSPLDLNREHGAIEVPHRPTLRLATAAFAPDGTRMGVLVLNLDMKVVFDRLRPASRAHHLYVVNADGDYVFHPDSSQTFGFELGTPHRLQDDLPALAPALAARRATSVDTTDVRGTPLGVALEPIRVQNGPVLTLVESVSEADLLAITRAVRAVGVWVGVIAIAVAALIAVALSQTLTRPLSKLTSAVEAYGQGRKDVIAAKVGAWSSHEIRTLAEAFASMGRTIRNRNAALAGQQEQLRSLVDRAPAPMILIDQDFKIAVANRTAARLFGYESSELIGEPVERLVPERMREPGSARLWGMALGSTPPPAGAGAALAGRRKCGDEVSIEVELTPIQTETGAFTLASFVDVGERDRAANWFKRLIEAAPNAKLVIDAQGRITLVNRAAERLFGYPRVDLLGQPIELLVPEHARADHALDRAKFMQDPQPRPMGAGRDLYVRCKNGGHAAVEIGLAPIETPDGPATLASIIDITERKRHEDELRRSNAELEQFAYVASHDLQEPLRMVASFTQLLSDRYHGQLDDKADRYIFFAVDGARRMQRLVADLLAFSRVGSQGKPLAPVASSGVVQSVLQLLQHTVRESGASVEVDELPMVMADEMQLRQVFQNLVGNGLKFRSQAPPHIRIRAQRKDARWQFAVSDNGIGIDPQYTERIFQMFQRLHDRGKFEGSGIGLAIAKRIVERHEGQIWVESSPGQGSTFYFTVAATGS